MSKELSFEEIVKLYRIGRLNNPDTWINHASGQGNIADAIIVSSLCINGENKKHPHQYRIKQTLLDHFKTELLSKKEIIGNSENFDQLYQIISATGVFGIGPLTKYDVSTRIGAYLKLFPEKVYLHAGTLSGARKLLGKIDKTFLTKKDLPKAFWKKDLQYWEIEDILCIFKDRFRNLKTIRNRINSFC